MGTAPTASISFIAVDRYRLRRMTKNDRPDLRPDGADFWPAVLGKHQHSLHRPFRLAAAHPPPERLAVQQGYWYARRYGPEPPQVASSCGDQFREHPLNVHSQTKSSETLPPAVCGRCARASRDGSKQAVCLQWAQHQLLELPDCSPPIFMQGHLAPSLHNSQAPAVLDAVSAVSAYFMDSSTYHAATARP